MKTELPIIERARKYGYIFWSNLYDDSMRALLGNRDSIEVLFLENKEGLKKVDWKYRRISVGWAKMRFIPEGCIKFILDVEGEVLTIKCK